MKLGRLVACVVAVVLAAAMLPCAAGASARHPREATGHLLLHLRGARTAAAVRAVCAATGTRPSDVHVLHGDLLSLTLPRTSSVDAAVSALSGVSAVKWAEPDLLGEPLDYVAPAYSAPNDPGYNSLDTWTAYNAGLPTGVYVNGKSWWLRDLGMPAVWQRSLNGTDTLGRHPLRAAPDAVKVAVLDSGLFPHEDLGNIVGGWNMIASYSSATGTYTTNSDVTPNDPSAPKQGVQNASHGTCVAGEIAAAVNNGVGAVGLGWDTKVVVYKIAGPWVDGYEPWGVVPGQIVWLDGACAAGIMRAADDGCKVISISAGWPTSAALQDAVNYAHAKGAIVVAAAGNAGNSDGAMLSPATCDNVVAAGSYGLDAGGARARSGFSSYGPQLDLMAPGEFIYGLNEPGVADIALGEPGYARWSGTSMSTPIIAGELAYIWRTVPGLSGDELLGYALADADDMGAAGRDDLDGYGAVDPGRMYDALVADYPTLAAPALSAPATSGPAVALAWTPVTGRDVRYDISLDGARVLCDVDATSAVVTATANGPHTVEVLPISQFNWSDASSAVTASVQVTGAPATVTRIAERDRYRLNAALSKRRFAHADHVVLVSGTTWPDALSAAPLAETYGGPVLLTSPLALSSAAAGELARLGATKVTIVGGPGSVSAAVVAQLRARHLAVDRISGTDRYDVAGRVAVRLARVRGSIDGSTVVVATGAAFRDALAGAAVAARKGWPVLLVRADGVPLATAQALRSIAATRAIVVGRPASVSGRVLAMLPHGVRVAGATDAGTPCTLAEWARASYPGDFSGRSYAIVSSAAFADGLSASGFAAGDGTLVLTTTGDLSAETATFLSAGRGRIWNAWIVGGTATISPAAEARVRACLAP